MKAEQQKLTAAEILRRLFFSKSASLLHPLRQYYETATNERGRAARPKSGGCPTNMDGGCGVWTVFWKIR